jgi:diaminohydroxyphosphoribosylaminopyrimidine deaminase/5-amino-6-(5-phosphoribosylamino)uracil reductase
MKNIHEQMMQRCLQLAMFGMGKVAPNPMVGAVLLYKDKIIGEGYHSQYGEAHAEVNCLQSVSEDKKHLIEKSTLYVNLEPCSHFGKTPPCTRLIIHHKIPQVVISNIDPFPKVSGSGIAQLREAGIDVTMGICEAEGKELNKRFFTFYEKKRPYIILKWAQTADGFIGLPGNQKVPISNEYTNRLVHKWRSGESAILIGTNTALSDDPRLTNRLWSGKSPVRIVLDKKLRLPEYLHIFDNEVPTLIFNAEKQQRRKDTEWIQIPFSGTILTDMLHVLYEKKILSVLIEGGAKTLQSFISSGIWDEARVISSNSFCGQGIPAPVLTKQQPVRKEEVSGDRIYFFENKNRLI